MPVDIEKEEICQTPKAIPIHLNTYKTRPPKNEQA